MSERGAMLFVKQHVSSIVSIEQWARALEYVAIKRANGAAWRDIAAIIAIDNPFNAVTE